ncbi:Bug family tripartite tricarboxylate transporter substrate binding protein [Paracoccus albus]|uniref:Bug family tripartite tricarboxylate transporter substrate binding protein n=1 Tax=Paracoccus albus TaxID=3017784 RepID=UPI0022F045D0|nr:tripartite tricarboxylate transporter substrate binding protein [Paracoccus albus]WBU62229.1 tripartite tricarboxylate transporter substrate binding protein [Paracoccus albus]
MIAGAFAALSAVPLAAQEWPTQPIHLIVPFSAGGPADLVARELGQRMGETLGQPVVVENMTGAGGIIAARHVASADPDGYTVFFPASGNVSVRPQIDGLDELVDQLEPVAAVSTSAHVMVVNAESDFHSVEDLIEYGREHPGELNYGSAGAGAVAHLGMARFANAAGIEMEHIPYGGTSAAVVDLAAGAIDALLSSKPSLGAMIDAGKIRVIGLTDEAPGEDAPLISETVEGYSYSTWYGMMVPAGTDASVISELNQAAAEAVADEDLQKEMAARSLTLIHTTPEEMGEMIRQDTEEWGEVIDAVGLRN